MPVPGCEECRTSQPSSSQPMSIAELIRTHPLRNAREALRSSRTSNKQTSNRNLSRRGSSTSSLHHGYDPNSRSIPPPPPMPNLGNHSRINSSSDNSRSSILRRSRSPDKISRNQNKHPIHVESPERQKKVTLTDYDPMTSFLHSPNLRRMIDERSKNLSKTSSKSLKIDTKRNNFAEVRKKFSHNDQEQLLNLDSSSDSASERHHPNPPPIPITPTGTSKSNKTLMNDTGTSKSNKTLMNDTGTSKSNKSFINDTLIKKSRQDDDVASRSSADSSLGGDKRQDFHPAFGGKGTSFHMNDAQVQTSLNNRMRRYKDSFAKSTQDSLERLYSYKPRKNNVSFQLCPNNMPVGFIIAGYALLVLLLIIIAVGVAYFPSKSEDSETLTDLATLIKNAEDRLPGVDSGFLTPPTDSGLPRLIDSTGTNEQGSGKLLDGIVTETSAIDIDDIALQNLDEQDTSLLEQAITKPVNDSHIMFMMPVTSKQAKIVKSWSVFSPDGNFNYGYINSDGAFKNETRLHTSCTVTGIYGYVDKKTGMTLSFPYQFGNPCQRNDTIKNPTIESPNSNFGDHNDLKKNPSTHTVINKNSGNQNVWQPNLKTNPNNPSTHTVIHVGNNNPRFHTPPAILGAGNTQQIPGTVIDPNTFGNHHSIAPVVITTEPPKTPQQIAMEREQQLHREKLRSLFKERFGVLMENFNRNEQQPNKTRNQQQFNEATKRHRSFLARNILRNIMHQRLQLKKQQQILENQQQVQQQQRQHQLNQQKQLLELLQQRNKNSRT